MMKYGFHLLLILITSFSLVAVAACSDNSTGSDASSAPSDHTVRKGSAMHKTGLSNPTANCTSCHGSDLKGGTSKVSCFSCHGTKW